MILNLSEEGLIMKNDYYDIAYNDLLYLEDDVQKTSDLENRNFQLMAIRFTIRIQRL